MDIANDLWLGQRQKIIVALEITRVVLETDPPVIGFIQPIALNHGAHRTVQNKDPFRQELFEACHHLDFARVIARV